MCCDFGPNFVEMERQMILFFSGSGVLVWWVFGCPCESGYCIVRCCTAFLVGLAGSQLRAKNDVVVMGLITLGERTKLTLYW